MIETDAANVDRRRGEDVGPGGNSLAFRLAYSDDGVISFKEASIWDLRHKLLPIAQPRNSN